MQTLAPIIAGLAVLAFAIGMIVWTEINHHLDQKARREAAPVPLVQPDQADSPRASKRRYMPETAAELMGRVKRKGAVVVNVPIRSTDVAAHPTKAERQTA